MAVALSPADGQPPAVQAAFALLRARFVAGLPQRWREIEAASSGAALEAALHRLVGAAASFGLHPLGEAARQAETLARGPAAAALSTQADPVAAGRHAALAEVRRLIDEAVTVR